MRCGARGCSACAAHRDVPAHARGVRACTCCLSRQGHTRAHVAGPRVCDAAERPRDAAVQRNALDCRVPAPRPVAGVCMCMCRCVCVCVCVCVPVHVHCACACACACRVFSCTYLSVHVSLCVHVCSFLYLGALLSLLCENVCVRARTQCVRARTQCVRARTHCVRARTQCVRTRVALTHRAARHAFRRACRPTLRGRGPSTGQPCSLAARRGRARRRRRGRCS